MASPEGVSLTSTLAGLPSRGSQHCWAWDTSVLMFLPTLQFLASLTEQSLLIPAESWRDSSMRLTWNKWMEREDQTNEGRKLPSGASTQGYSSSLFSSGFTGEGGCPQQLVEWRMFCEHQGNARNSPPVLIPVKTNQLIVHLYARIPWKFHSIQAWRDIASSKHSKQGQAANSSKPEPPQNTLGDPKG